MWKGRRLEESIGEALKEEGSQTWETNDLLAGFI